jgi:PAS domain S-box-containing protein
MRPNLLAVFVFICAAISAIFAWVAWRNRTTRGSALFSAFLASMTLYAFGYGMELSSPNLAGMLLWSKIGYLGIYLFPTLFLLFVLQYTGRDRWITRRNVTLLFLIPSLLLTAKLTDETFHWVYRTVWVDTSAAIPLLGYTPGLLYSFALYAAFPVGLGIILLWQKGQNTPDLYRRQVALMVASAIPPLLVFILYMSKYQPFPSLAFLDLNVFMFVFWGFGLAWAVFRYRLFKLVPIARDSVFERLSDGVLVLDDQSRLVDANPVALKIMGWEQAPLGQYASQIFSTWEELKDICQSDSNMKPIRSEMEHILGDKIILFDMSATPLVDKTGSTIGCLIVIHDITERKQAEDALLKVAAFEERQRMARDLHDSVNQSIHGMVLFSETMVATLDKNNTLRAREIAERIQESALQALKETRRLLYQIQPANTGRNVNLIQDLEIRLLTVERRAGVKANIIQEGSIEAYPQEWHENLFWITIEALNNALKHAQARNVQIFVSSTPSDHNVLFRQLRLEIIDDGKGFDPDQIQSGGFGLQNMRERAQLLGGVLNIKSNPEGGTVVSFFGEIEGIKE